MKLLNYTKGLLCDSWLMARTSFGRALREAGLEIDVKGSIQTEDIAHLQPLSRHRNILSLPGRILQISPSAYVASSSTVFGSVQIGQNSYMGFGSVINGLQNPIRIGANTKVGENSVLETNVLGNDEAYPVSLTIGNDVNIQHNCHLMSCIVDDDVHIGFKTYVGEGCQLERGCVIAPNSYVPAGTRIPSYTLWAGSPARYVKQLNKEEQNKLGEQSKQQIRIEERL